MQTKYILKLVFYFLLFQCAVFASNVVDISTLKSDNLLKNSYIYKDQTNSETIETIKDKSFTPINQTKSLSFGYSPNFNVWIKFTLHNSQNEPISKILEFDNPLVTNIILYENEFSINKEGLLDKKIDRKTVNPTFLINLDKNDIKYYPLLPYPKSKVLFGYDINISDIKSKKYVILVESEKSVLKAYQLGIRNVLAIGGSSISKYHIELLKQNGITNVIILFDQDKNIKDIKKNIDKFVERKGILIYITKEDFDNFIDFEYNKELVCINHNNVILFLEDEGNLEKIKRDKIYHVESNYFHFLTLNRDRDTLEKRYCHHDEANLEIEELEYLGLE